MYCSSNHTSSFRKFTVQALYIFHGKLFSTHIDEQLGDPGYWITQYVQVKYILENIRGFSL